jgi:hypothetical protein
VFSSFPCFVLKQSTSRHISFFALLHPTFYLYQKDEGTLLGTFWGHIFCFPCNSVTTSIIIIIIIIIIAFP